MKQKPIKERVEAALRRVLTAGAGADVVSAGLVRRIDVTPLGDVHLDLHIPASESGEMAATIRAAASSVEDVQSVHLTVRAAAEQNASGPAIDAGAEPDRAPPPERKRRRPLPVVGRAEPSARPRPAGRGAAARRPSEAPPLTGVEHVLAVSSGKGGVGKSTVSTNLAAALSGMGHAVGLLDGDVYGPDIPTMFGTQTRPRMADERIIPPEAHGVKLMSMGFLVDEDTPAIWRGPIIMGIIRQFLQQVDWGKLDYLIVDLPPGTGDAQLSLVQLTRVHGAVMVTTPQDVAVGGVLKGIRMFQTVDVPIVGVVENMSGFVCPSCGDRHAIFGGGGGERLAASVGLPFLGAVPLGTAVREEADAGVPTVVGRPDSPEGMALAEVARRVKARLHQLTTEVVERAR